MPVGPIVKYTSPAQLQWAEEKWHELKVFKNISSVQTA